METPSLTAPVGLEAQEVKSPRRQIHLCPLHKVFGMLEGPGVIRCHMIGYKIQDQGQALLREHVPRLGKPLWSAEVCIHNVPMHAVSRADIIRKGIVW